MARSPSGHTWKSLDTDLHRIGHLELAASYVARPMVGTGVALAFMVLAGIAAAVMSGQEPMRVAMIAAAVFGAYLAINIGANDVANYMGPAVGARVLSMGGAIAIAAICESAGALLAGGDVAQTIAGNIIDSAALADAQTLIWAMLAAMISAALWVNFATWISAPVSTTHSIVGGVMGAGIAAQGLSAVHWDTMGMIAAGWIVAPLLGGACAAAVLALIKSRIMYRANKIAAAQVWVPVLIGMMAGAFGTYLALKGLVHVVAVGRLPALAIGLGAGLVAWAAVRPVIRRQSAGLENRNRSLKKLFGLPLVCSTALLSFAHGANDVANAVGPAAAIIRAAQSGTFAESVAIPLWIMIIGAFGISFGLFLFGPRLIRMVGSRITKLNPMRAYCVALATALTVILASWLGLPVSSTHIAVGGVFGVGFFREWYLYRRLQQQGGPHTPDRRLASAERRRRKLVRRSHLMTVLAAWTVTVPTAAGLSAGIFLMLSALIG